MATRTDFQLYCEWCKSEVMDGVKCQNCTSYYHLNCVSDHLIHCCETTVKGCDDDLEFLNAIEDLPGSDKKAFINIFAYIIKQKDILIEELNDKIDILKNQIDLMNKFNSQKEESECIPNTIETKKQKNKINKKSKANEEGQKINNESNFTESLWIVNTTEMEKCDKYMEDDERKKSEYEWKEVKSKRKQPFNYGGKK